MKIRILIAALTGLALFGALMGCSKDNTTGAGVGHVTVHLTDAPGDYDEVNLVVNRVEILRGDEQTGTWESLKEDSTSYDLLELQNGVLTVLALGDVPAGSYSQIRLILGPGSNVVVDGVTHPLKIPSGMTSGLKLIGNFVVPAGGDVDLTLDFDAARSIHLTGNGQYILNPVVRLVVNATVNTGRIIGHLLPEGVAATVYAMAGAETLQTTTPGSNGRFTLSTLLAGTYSVRVDADTTYRDTTLSGVEVTAGATTDLGDIQLTPAPAPAPVTNP